MNALNAGKTQRSAPTINPLVVLLLGRPQGSPLREILGLDSRGV